MNNSLIKLLFSPKAVSLSRRSLLTGAASTAGLTLFPLLNQLALANTVKPRRFVFFVEGNGVEPITMLAPSARQALNNSFLNELASHRYWYEQYRHSAVMDIASPDLAEAKSLASLEGLADRASVVFGLSSKISGGGHSNFHGALACAKTSNLVPGGPTIDALLAAAVGSETPFDAMRLGVINSGASLDFGITALRRGKASPVVMNPNTARTIYFAPAVDAVGFSERAQVYDVIRRGIDSSLQHFPSGAERAKLEAYAESIDVLANRHDRVAGHSFATMDIPGAIDTADPLEKYAQQAKLATAALIGGLTNVAVLPIGSSGEGAFDLRYGGAYNINRHSLHHQAETKSGEGGGEFADMIHAITADKIKNMTDMAKALAATPDSDGEDMLANTVLVYLPDTGERHHSRAAEWPLLIIGGEAMGLKQGGRTLVYPGIKEDAHRQLSNVWNTMGHLAGLDLNDFGAESEQTRKALGPLSELMS
ncbi:DUF1552 domain-containing protein [Agaribacterium haliotis]|uniref:DUF1552 domain-containing protein n=1 Tax=Agaribacterium haliotis TaxID=2013869 RepID=UPI000BB53572|nr:DUF1552 domain-containing protein [Agaribacterium haliotis]